MQIEWVWRLHVTFTRAAATNFLSAERCSDAPLQRVVRLSSTLPEHIRGQHLTEIQRTVTGWHGERSVADELVEEPYRFEFLQAVRLLEQWFEASRLRTGAAVRDPVRFRASFNLSFPASEISALTAATAEQPPVLTVTFFGVGGIGGPLPTSFSEDILDRLSHRDTAAAAFLDIFHNRLLTLLYRIHKAHRPAMATAPPDRTATARHLYSLFGLGMGSLARQFRAPGDLLRYAGLLAAQPRSAAGLATLVEDYFGVPVHLQQFAGAWVELEPAHTTTLGATGRNNALGRTTVVGTRAWIQDAGIRLRLGPLDHAQFAGFLPGGWAHRRLAELVALYAGPDLVGGRRRAGHGAGLAWPHARVRDRRHANRRVFTGSDVVRVACWMSACRPRRDRLCTISFVAGER